MAMISNIYDSIFTVYYTSKRWTNPGKVARVHTFVFSTGLFRLAVMIGIKRAVTSTQASSWQSVYCKVLYVSTVLMIRSPSGRVQGSVTEAQCSTSRVPPFCRRFLPEYCRNKLHTGCRLRRDYDLKLSLNWWLADWRRFQSPVPEAASRNMRIIVVQIRNRVSETSSTARGWSAIKIWDATVLDATRTPLRRCDP